MQDPKLMDQSRGRELTSGEAAFAAALEKIYATGTLDFAGVVAALNETGEPMPSGRTEPWTLDAFERELKEINASHDAAYAENGYGA